MGCSWEERALHGKIDQVQELDLFELRLTLGTCGGKEERKVTDFVHQNTVVLVFWR